MKKIKTPISDEEISELQIGDKISLSGVMYTGRDAALPQLVELIKKDSSNADQAIMFMMIAKYLERIGDHAVNVCEWTKYSETGVHIKY